MGEELFSQEQLDLLERQGGLELWGWPVCPHCSGLGVLVGRDGDVKGHEDFTHRRRYMRTVELAEAISKVAEELESPLLGVEQVEPLHQEVGLLSDKLDYRLSKSCLKIDSWREILQFWKEASKLAEDLELDKVVSKLGRKYCKHAKKKAETMKRAIEREKEKLAEVMKVLGHKSWKVGPHTVSLSSRGRVSIRLGGITT